MSRGRLLGATALAAALSAAAAVAALGELPAGLLRPGPVALYPFGLLAAASWALIAPAAVPPRPRGAWLVSAALACGVFAPLLVAGARLASASPSQCWAAGGRLIALWLAASGVRAVLGRISPRPAVHHLGLAGLVLFALPLIEYLGRDPLDAPRLFPPGTSPVEWCWSLQPAAPPSATELVGAIALPALAGAIGLVAAREERPS